MANELFDPAWPLIVVVEGPPKVGKSHLAEFIAEKARMLNQPYTVYQPPAKFELAQFVNRLTVGLKDGEVAILDGFHLTVSARIRRRSFTFTNDVIAIERLLDNMHAIKLWLMIGQMVMAHRINLADYADTKRRLSRWAPVTQLIERLETSSDDELRIKPYVQRFNSVPDDMMRTSEMISRMIELMRGL